MAIFKKIIVSCFLIAFSLHLLAQADTHLPSLHVEGRYLKDSHGNLVSLHGFAQTYSPWFNEEGKIWSNYDVNTCLTYNEGLVDKILKAGWKMNFIRLHMDPYWSNTPGQQTTGENDISAFDFDRFKKYLDEVFVPMAEYASTKGLYVIMRPPGVCPEKIAVGDAYNQYLIKVWGYIAQHKKLINNPSIMFELANEPVQILGTDGTYGSGSQGHFDKLKTYFQAVVDAIRAVGCQNVLWVPGLGYQSQYKGYAVNPIIGENIGYAVHIYPGWFDEGTGYQTFKNSWDKNIKPVADLAPIVVTEMDWAPEKYKASWGKGVTGVAGKEGFGANFKAITDTSGNVSWLLFTGPDLLAKFTGVPPGNGVDTTFLNDPNACPTPVFNWFKEYAKVNFSKPDFKYQSHGDNGDGTFTNPVVFADFPDPDVIRVGDVYYMVSTTMHIFPGATILKSYDLVNWEYCSNPLESMTSSACYNLDGCNRYGAGQWATSLKYNNGKYYLYFNTLGEGNVLLTASKPEGPWEMKKLSSFLYDPGLFFDDDGKVYVVYGINEIRITELDENFNMKAGTDKLVFTKTFRDGLEGNHLYKINGKYFIYSTYGGWPAFQVALRSSNIYGPYEEKKVIDDDNIHQGALVQTQTGEWWTVLFYDKGAYGRLTNLEPVTWVDNWPMVGVDGKGVKTYRKPNVGTPHPVKVLPTNDVFRNYKLGMQWGWNHNPDNSKWSLVDKPGSLRLKTVSVVDSFMRARNTLTQRIFGYYSDTTKSYGTIKMNIKNMMDGDVAGLAVFQDPYAYIGVKVTDGAKKLVMENKKELQTGITINDSIIYLRAVACYGTSKANFYYSLDNVNYTKFGGELDMKFNLSVFTGNKFSIFNFPTKQTGGFVDVDWFSTEEKFTEDAFYDSNFKGFSKDELTVDSLIVESHNIGLLTGSTKALKLTALYHDGHTEDVTTSASLSSSKPEVSTVINGLVSAKLDGDAVISISFQSKLGDVKSTEIHVYSMTFPLTSKLFNPSIWEKGSFNSANKELKTGQYGFGGWTYDNGIDLSKYKYLIAELASDNTSNASFRLFDESSYWSGACENDFGSSRKVVVDLSNISKKVNGQVVKMNPSHIYIVGFWTLGNNPIQIKNVYLSNDDGTATAFTVSASSNETTYGTVSGSGAYMPNQTAYLVANPAAGIKFNNWTDNRTVVSSDAEYPFAVTANRSLVANFARASYTLAVSANNAQMGTVSGAATFTYNQTAAISANSNAGYKFVNWTEGATEVSKDANYTFVVTSSRNLKANFSDITFAIETSVNTNLGGTVSGAGNIVSNGTARLTASPLTGYAFTNWTENGTEVSKDAVYTFTASSNRTLVANFTKITGIEDYANRYTIIVYPNPSNGIFSLKLSNSYYGKLILRVSTISSQTVIEKEIEKQIEEIIVPMDINPSAPGVYILEVSGGSFHQNFKLLVK